ncbi:5'-3' exonuclease H3TH domain-containing protein [Micromonospora sp. NPDC049366]|uniref:5'-3' exonuclease H3TH domain-containing protein n=1 Tax=Micromonospora sp. NPDC049366 TaxID=3364271 RepID=UPI0037BDF8FB
MTGQTRRDVPWDEINQRRRDKAARAPGVPRDVTGCTGETCTAAIRWAVTVDGKRMPVDFAPDPAGNLVRVMVAAGDWRIRVLAAGEEPPPGAHRWTSHYATCPDAAKFRNAGRNAGARRRRAQLEETALATLAPLAPTTITGPPASSAPAPGVLLAVDGDSLTHRAWHAYERTGMTAPDGRPVFAVYGFLRLLAGIIDRVKPDALVVGFDDRTSSARRDQHPDYKAQRSEKDPDLYAQRDAIIVALRALALQVVVPDGLEADDVLGSAAAAAETSGWRCVIATSDRDAFALITDTTSVLRLVDGLDNAVNMTPADLADRYGVTPAQYLDYAALRGDTSDNLPGVHGIGEKTAAKLLAALGSVDAALADPEKTTAAIGKAYAAKLATDDARAALDRNRRLMAIRRDVPVDVEACRPSVDAATAAAVLRGLHLPSLVDRVTAALCPPPPSPSPPAPAPRRRHLTVGPPPADPGPPAGGTHPPAPPLERATPAPTCPDCGRPAAALLPLAQLDAGGPTLTGREVLVDRDDPSGDLLAVQVGGVWAVRPIPAGEYYLPPANRRRAHYCVVYPYKCDVPGCGAPARLYPGGRFCDDHPPSTPRPGR